MNEIDYMAKKMNAPMYKDIIGEKAESHYQLNLGNGHADYAKFKEVWFSVNGETDHLGNYIILDIRWVCTLSEYEALEAKLKPKTLKLSNKMRVIQITGDTKCELSHDEIAEIIQDVIYDLAGQRRTDAGLKLKELLQKLTS